MLLLRSDGPVVHCENSTVEGDTLESLCAVMGNPTPDVKWLKDGKPVDPTVRLSRNYTGEYVIEAEGASLVQKRLQPAIYCEYPAKIQFGTSAVQHFQATHVRPPRCTGAVLSKRLHGAGAHSSQPHVHGRGLPQTLHNVVQGRRGGGTSREPYEA